MNSLKELQDMMKKAAFGEAPLDCCVKCKRPFSHEIVFTDAGWRETEISQLCELCWDEICKDPEDEEE